jgi:hypothetical protein
MGDHGNYRIDQRQSGCRQGGLWENLYWDLVAMADFETRFESYE